MCCVDLDLPVLPERLNLTVWNDDAAEGHECHDDQRVNKRGEDGIGRVCSDGLPDARVDQLKHDLEICVRIKGPEDQIKCGLTMTKNVLPAEYAELGSPAVKYQQT